MLFLLGTGELPLRWILRCQIIASPGLGSLGRGLVDGLCRLAAGFGRGEFVGYILETGACACPFFDGSIAVTVQCLVFG